MKKIELYDSKGIITKEAMAEIEIIGKTASCECPRHLVDILKSVQAFTEYQSNCLNQNPQDEIVHEWLLASSKNIEHILSGTIVNLARMEGLIDPDNNIVK